jgi:hypothetical protein
VKAGSVSYRLPIEPGDETHFDDTRDMVLGFQLVDVTRRDGKDSISVRYGGSMRLTPRFPLKYEFKVFPAGSSHSETGVIDQGGSDREFHSIGPAE